VGVDAAKPEEVKDHHGQDRNAAQPVENRQMADRFHGLHAGFIMVTGGCHRRNFLGYAKIGR
jgi:hypothetical protein